MNKHTFSTANLTDLELKEQGNRNFTARKYEDAIKLYSMAIVSCSFNLIDKNQFFAKIIIKLFNFFFTNFRLKIQKIQHFLQIVLYVI